MKTPETYGFAIQSKEGLTRTYTHPSGVRMRTVGGNVDWVERNGYRHTYAEPVPFVTWLRCDQAKWIK